MTFKLDGKFFEDVSSPPELALPCRRLYNSTTISSGSPLVISSLLSLTQLLFTVRPPGTVLRILTLCVAALSALAYDGVYCFEVSETVISISTG